ncbi:filamentous hemagglutinin N-terminal domain-containing protein, partial [Dapis sp. BLCC M172]|uniref:two-partner secretion domain-containing protein n=1 Tax=Dapis sp. BLCC M172 TaxID=2975281 RepID=UPI003CEAA148
MKTLRLGHPFSLLMSLLAIAATSPAKSQPITPANDGTGTTVTPQGTQFNIEGGTQSGANLFHSFDQFNVPTNQTANFLTTPDTRNILGRVTGGNASYINGLIQVIGGNSNLFLMNPAGIMFGPNGSLNIPASFSVTTATGIGFDNNNFWFKAMGTNDYSNLVGDPTGYRFNVSNPGAIVNEGNLHSGENLTLLGGTIINTGQLSTTNGNITIAAVEGGSVLRISQPGHLLSLEVDSRREDISNLDALSLPELLTGGSENNATSIIVNSNGELVLTDNTIIADTPGNVFVSGNIVLSTQEQESESNFIVLANNDITINNLIENAGFVEFKAGRSINLNADIDTSVGNGNIDLLGNNNEMNLANPSDGKASINQLDGTTLNAGSDTINIQLGNSGEVGDINLANLTTTGQVLVNANGGNIAGVSENSLINAGSVLFQTSGDGGIGLIDAPLQLNVENLEAVSGSGGIFFDVGNVNIGGVSENVDGIKTIGGGDIILDSRGDVTVSEDIKANVVTDGETGGDININAKNLSVIDGAEISASTFAKGDAGTVEINATDTVVLDGEGGDPEYLTGVTSSVEEGAEGDAGGVTITTGSLFVKNGAQILASTFAKGDAGTVEINATDTVVLDGEGGDPEYLTGVTSSVEEGAEGDAGGVTITTGSLFVKNGAQILASTFAKGDAGTVEINATDTVVFDGADPEFITGVTSSVEEGAEGDGGTVTITTGSLFVKNGAQILANTFGNGNAGNVEIHATETVVLEGEYLKEYPSTASSTVAKGAKGDGGTVTITTGSLFVKNGADVSAEVEEGAEGNGGDVIITTGSLFVKNGGEIFASNLGKGDTGNVNINATDTVVFDGGDSEFAGVFSEVLSGGERKRGDVTLTTNSLFVKNGAEISTSTLGKGNAGDVTIATESLFVKNEGVISASTLGKGNAGNVNINATDTVVLDRADSEYLTGVTSSVEEGAEGDAGGVTITTGSLFVKNGAQILANTFGNGNAGNVEIHATETVVLEGEYLKEYPSTASSTVAKGAKGDGGTVTITTGSLFVKNGADVSAEVEEGAEGNGGNVIITTNSLFVKNGAQISSATFAQGNAGTVNITAEDAVVFDGGSAFSDVIEGAEGDAGSVTITTGSLEIINGGQILASTSGNGEAGNIFIKTDTQLTLDENAQISAFTESSGKGGNIILFAPETLNISGNGQITVRSSSTGNAGQIDILSPNITLSDGIDITAFTTGLGNAGNINLEGENINIQPNTQILAFTETTGEGGNITVRATETLNLDVDSQLSVETNRGGKAGNI